MSLDIRQKIRQTAMAMLEAGELPTGRGVHKLVGSGSATTIYNELRLWAKDMADSQRIAGIPPELVESFIAFLDLAKTRAGDDFEQERIESRNLVDALQQQIEDQARFLDDYHQGMETRIRELTANLEAAKAARDAAIQAAAHEKALMQEKLDSASALSRALVEQAEEARQRSARIESAHASDIERHRAELGRIKVQQEANENRLFKQLDEARQAIKAMEAQHAQELAVQEGKVLEMNRRLTEKEMQEQNQSQMLVTLTERLGQLETTAQESITRAVEAEATNKALTAQVAQLLAVLGQKQSATK